MHSIVAWEYSRNIADLIYADKPAADDIAEVPPQVANQAALALTKAKLSVVGTTVVVDGSPTPMDPWPASAASTKRRTK